MPENLQRYRVIASAGYCELGVGIGKVARRGRRVIGLQGGLEGLQCRLRLPGMSGYELVAALRARPGFAAADFVALSGYGQPEDRVRTEAAGFCAHLVKPPAAQELHGLLAALVQRRHLTET